MALKRMFILKNTNFGHYLVSIGYVTHVLYDLICISTNFVFFFCSAWLTKDLEFTVGVKVTL